MAEQNQEILLKLKAIDELTPIMLKALQNMEAQSGRLADAITKIQSPIEQTERNTHGLNAGLLSLAAGWTLLKGTVDMAMAAYEKVSAQFAHAIDEAIEAQKAQNQLTGALVSTGQYTQDLSDKVESYSNALERNKGISGEQTKALIAQAVQMGLNVDKAIQMEEAARKLAVAAGTDANSAFSMLQGAMAGQSRALGRILPQVKDLTEAQLKQGAATDIVNKVLTAQYQLYEGSFSASVNKAKNALSNVYEAIGNIIIQNPIVIKAVSAFADWMVKLQGSVESLGKWITENQSSIEQWGTAISQTLQIGSIALGAWAVSAGIAAVATGGLAAVVAVLASPITLAVAAAVGLTAAFHQWPDLFDKIVGGLKILVSSTLEGFASMASVAAKVSSVFNKDLSQSLDSVSQKLMVQSESWGMAGAQQIEYAGTAQATAKIAEDSAKSEQKAIDSTLAAISRENAAIKELTQSYAGLSSGNASMRRALEEETQVRDTDLKNFESYLNNKMRLAVSKEQEQQAQVKKIRAELLTSGGPADKTAGAEAEISAEENKQQKLQQARRQGIINQQQLDEELFASQQRIREQQLVEDNAYAQARADALGDSPAAFQEKQAIKEAQFQQELASRTAQAQRAGATDEQVASMQQASLAKHRADSLAAEQAHREAEITLAQEHQFRKAQALGETEEALEMKKQMEEERFQIKLQDRLIQAEQEGATEAEVQAMREQQELEHKARMNEMTQQYWERQAQLNEQAGNDWEALLARMRASQEKHGAIIGTMMAIQNSGQYKATMQALSDLSTLRNSHSKKAFEIGKKAAMAETVVRTFMSATAAFSALAGIPLVGPALGAAAAAAAIAAGYVNLQNIAGQKFEGGQGDEGMDFIPQNLDGKSFTVSGGERIVQPSANKELTEFLAREKQSNPSSGGRGGQVINITLNYNGMGSAQDARSMAEILVKEIRSMSERGTPIISDKGVVKSA
jgi:hypothetical protein